MDSLGVVDIPSPRLYRLLSLTRTSETGDPAAAWRAVDERTITRRSQRNTFSYTDGVYTVTIDLSVVDERYEANRIDVRSYPPEESGRIVPLTVRALGRLPLGSLVRKAVAELRARALREVEEQLEAGAKEVYRDSAGRLRASFEAAGPRRSVELTARPLRRPGRPALEDQVDLRQVAAIYNDAAAFRGGNPTKTLMELANVPRSTASRWVKRCRKLGLIPPYKR